MQNLLMRLSADQLKRAAEIKEQIDALQAALDALLKGKSRAVVAKAKPAKVWTKPGGSVPAATQKPRRTLSPAARAKLSAIAKARWRQAKAEGKTHL